ncbi:uncharacterized protein TRIVIDRAFT_123651, partial [Trichoderma virens Gv29-8]
AESYEEARIQCISKVEAVIAECRRTNLLFLDNHFDIENDLFANQDSNRQLDSSTYPFEPPKSVHRVPWIFKDPQFMTDSSSGYDVKQGVGGNCWWIAAVTTIAHRQDIMEKICVARNEACGVYGFVFHKDGGWISTVVDDNLYLSESDFNCDDEVYDPTGDKARFHKAQNQSNSEALHFAKCSSKNETWLPLLEKAYAKVHGDYQSLNGGWYSNAIEDLTGGVTTVIPGNGVLDKDRLWSEIMASALPNSTFVFGLSVSANGANFHRNGLITNHTYSVLTATEVTNEVGYTSRLLKIRNPWGENASQSVGEWSGPWSKGSSEWTLDIMKKINNESLNNGVFWMSFDDVLDNFKWLYKTRLFDDHWNLTQKWIQTSVPWVPTLLPTIFLVDITEPALVVFALSQVDSRYFTDLQGRYYFTLQFILKHRESGKVICECRAVNPEDNWSISCEVNLDCGIYEVVPRAFTSIESGRKSPLEVLKVWSYKNPSKLQKVGLQHDLAYS